MSGGAEKAIKECWEDLIDSGFGLMSEERAAQMLCQWGKEVSDSGACRIYCKMVER